MPTEVWRPPITVEFQIDGRRHELIPVSSEHRQVLLDGFSKLSDQSRYQRFMASMSELSRAEVDYLTELDLVTRFAWGLLIDGEPAGIGRYAQITTSPSSAEVAVTVIDDYQGQGAGRLLVGAIAVVAGSCGYSRLEFEVLAENRAMLRLLESIGATLDQDGPIVHAAISPADVPLTPPPTPDDLLAAAGSARSTRTTT